MLLFYLVFHLIHSNSSKCSQTQLTMKQKIQYQSCSYCTVALTVCRLSLTHSYKSTLCKFHTKESLVTGLICIITCVQDCRTINNHKIPLIQYQRYCTVMLTYYSTSSTVAVLTVCGWVIGRFWGMTMDILSRCSMCWPQIL